MRPYALCVSALELPQTVRKNVKCFGDANGWLPMTVTQFVVPLQGSPTDRYRHYHLLEKRAVREFTIQYEAEIGGVWYEIVRYDTAHGRPHKDLLHPDGTETKEEFPYYTNAEVLTFGQNDIRRNWKKYRARYEKEMRERR